MNACTSLQLIVISTVDNKIVLSKYENLTKDNVVNLIINLLKKYFKKNVLFTSRNAIIDFALINKEVNVIELFDENIMNLVENRKDIVNYNHHELSYNVFPLVINGDLYGSIIICDFNEINEFELEIIRFNKMFLENYLE